MGYQAEKNKIEAKMRRIKLICLCVTLVALLGLCIFSAFVPPDTWKYHVGKPYVSPRKTGEMRIHFIDVGQGDCILIELPDGKTALIDGGDGKEETETTVLRYLNALKINTIDHLIVSHADEDHCGSLDKVLKEKTILNAYLPIMKVENAGEEYAEFYAQLLEEDCEKMHSKRYIDLSDREGKFGYTFAFLHPSGLTTQGEEDWVEDNLLSACLWLDYEGVSALFTGDGNLITEEILLRDDALGAFDALGVDLDSTELLKVGHHGSADGTSLEFLQYLNVKEAFISCEKNNLYGHPAEEVLYNLEKVGAAVHRTDEKGTIVVTIRVGGGYSVS